MYYNKCILINTLLRLNWKLFLEKIRKFEEVLSSYYKVTFISRKITRNTPKLLLQTRAKMKILMSVLLKIDDYFNFSSTCKYEISIYLLFNIAIILKKLKIPQVNVKGQDRVVGVTNAPLAPLCLWPLELSGFQFFTYKL